MLRDEIQSHIILRLVNKQISRTLENKEPLNGRIAELQDPQFNNFSGVFKILEPLNSGYDISKILNSTNFRGS